MSYLTFLLLGVLEFSVSTQAFAANSVTKAIATSLVKRGEISHSDKPLALAWTVNWLEHSAGQDATIDRIKSMVYADVIRAPEATSELNERLQFSEASLETIKSYSSSSSEQQDENHSIMAIGFERRTADHEK